MYRVKGALMSRPDKHEYCRQTLKDTPGKRSGLPEGVTRHKKQAHIECKKMFLRTCIAVIALAVAAAAADELQLAWEGHVEARKRM